MREKRRWRTRTLVLASAVAALSIGMAALWFPATVRRMFDVGHTGGSIRFTYTLSPESAPYNLSASAAATLPGNLPRAFAEAREKGNSTIVVRDEHQWETLLAGLHFDELSVVSERRYVKFDKDAFEIVVSTQ